MMLSEPLALFKFAGPLVNRHCFLFAAHHHSLLNLIMASHVHWTTYCKHRKLLTSSLTVTQQSHTQIMHTTIRFLSKTLYSSSVPLCPCLNLRQITRHLHVFQAPIHTKYVSSAQQGYVAVRERGLSCFKEEWERILKEQDVTEPFWSVKWIIEHVLRKYSHSEVCISLSLSFPPSPSLVSILSN